MPWYKHGGRSIKEKNKTLKIGVIGCGWAGGTLHIPALQSSSEAEVVAIADINQFHLKQVGNKYHIQNRYTDFRDLLKNQEVEVIAVCVPASSHVEIALAALDAEKHVFIEKPLALSMDEMDVLIRKAKDSYCKATVGFNLRCHRFLRQAKKIIREGTLGKIESIRTVWTSNARHQRDMPEWRNSRERGGGTIMEIGIHHYDLWRFLLDCEVEEVFVLGCSHEWDDDVTAVNGRMTSGVIVSSVFSEHTCNNNQIEIHGRNGLLIISCYRFDGLEFQPIMSMTDAIPARMKKTINSLKCFPNAVSTISKGGVFMESYRTEWEHFIHAILNDAEVACTLEDGMRAVKVAIAATESASLGKPVKIAQAPRKIIPVRLDGRIKT